MMSMRLLLHSFPCMCCSSLMRIIDETWVTLASMMGGSNSSCLLCQLLSFLLIFLFSDIELMRWKLCGGMTKARDFGRWNSWALPGLTVTAFRRKKNFDLRSWHCFGEARSGYSEYLWCTTWFATNAVSSQSRACSLLYVSAHDGLLQCWT